MKRTIRRRTEITIESLEITTIRTTPLAASPEVSTKDDGGTSLPEVNWTEDRLATRMELAKQILRRKKR